MSKYNFDSDLNRRNTESEKWNDYPADILPMWVADSDYAVLPEIVESIRDRLNNPTLGYGQESIKLKNLIKKRMQDRFGWKISTDWICFVPGVVAGLNISRIIAGNDGDDVLTALPVYPHLQNQSPIIKKTMKFFRMIENDERYTPDFDEMDKVITDKASLLLLCNPHNPVGTVYSEDELREFEKRVIKNDLIVCSDEIHADFVLNNDLKHIPFASLSPDMEKRTITLMAASKTYNIAGLNCSYAIIADKELRTKFKTQLKGLVGGVNILGFIATEVAYEYGAEWEKQQIIHLQKNADYCYQQINKIDGLSMFKMEATYLAWIDCSKIIEKISKKGFSNAYELFLDAGLALSNGDAFADRNFVRINLACSFNNLEKAINIIKSKIKEVE